MTAAGQLLLTLTGVRLLFACLQSNGAMEAAAHRVLGLSRGRVALLPLVLFVLAALLAMVGPGAILSAALLAPMAMRTGVPVGISPFLIALMIGNGANAGNLSPFSSIGVIVNGLMTRSGLLRVWVFHAAAHLAVALGAYLFFGGFRLSWRTTGTAHQNIPPFTRPQALDGRRNRPPLAARLDGPGPRHGSSLVRLRPVARRRGRSSPWSSPSARLLA